MSAESPEPVLLVDDAAGVRTLLLNRPAAFNSLTLELKESLLGSLRAASQDSSIRAVVISGAGDAFCAGQDLKEHVEALQRGDGSSSTTVERHYNPLIETITGMPKPVIAAVNGAAAGAGASLACAADLRIADRSARFLMAFANVGLSADSGASWTLPRLIGYGRAMEMMLLAQPVGAEEALAVGLVNRLVPDGTALRAAQELAARMATGPTASFAALKEALRLGAASPLPDALASEARLQHEAGSSADHREAVEAFVAKRPPRFAGN
ncbi:enoyl-CoA hydratase/isomerase family protein [Actinoalloteichus spitiensis]|uniref:enoyl-CoA hydratase/isomerase family protein n=1 Tax=Actinoalloteichus spitiensis TaxID=252394 RepID=UPI000584D1FA|nr:enoyl-CoA hydratase-related protein [Actinoalloteichus spitiensis]